MIFEYFYQGFGTIVEKGNKRGSPSTLFQKSLSIELSENQSNFLEQYEIVPFQYITCLRLLSEGYKKKFKN
jgi:hypothetical protein